MGFVRKTLGSIFGTDDAADASRDAAQTQANAIQQGIRAQKQAYNEVAPGMAQYMTPEQAAAFGFKNVKRDPNSAMSQLRAAAGAGGAEAQQAFYDNFVEDPGTQWLREQGVGDINKQLAASGGLGGGSRLKAVSQFNQNLANQQLQSRLGQLGSVANTDIGLGSSLANLRTGLGSAQANAYQGMGNAIAQGQVAAGQAGANTFNSAMGAIGTIGGIAAGFSDRRLKENIKKVGQTADLNVYEWTWKDEYKGLVNNEPTIGFMADEVMLSYPEAVWKDKSGFYKLDYSRLGE